MSLIFYLAKRALARMFGQMQQQKQQSSRTHADPYQQSSSTGHDVVETIWAGMGVNQLRTAFGTPQSKQNIQGGEVWTYANLNGQGTETSITIENGMVKSWQNSIVQNKAISF